MLRISVIFSSVVKVLIISNKIIRDAWKRFHTNFFSRILLFRLKQQWIWEFSLSAILKDIWKVSYPNLHILKLLFFGNFLAWSKCGKNFCPFHPNSTYYGFWFYSSVYYNDWPPLSISLIIYTFSFNDNNFNFLFFIQVCSKILLK